MKSFIKKISLLLLLIILLSGNIALAQDIGIGDLNTVANQSGYATNVVSDSLIDTLVGQIIAIVLGLVGSIFLLLIVISGFQWMTAGGNEEKVASAKKRITGAILGLALTLFAFIISNIVFSFAYRQTGYNPNTEQTQ